MGYPAFNAGQRLTAALLTAMQALYSEQTADQTKTSSTTLEDSEISVVLAANAKYIGWLDVGYSAATAADIKFAFTIPSGATVQRKNILYDDAAASGAATAQSVNMRQRAGTTEQEVGGTDIANFHSYFEKLWITTGASGGALTLQFAQQTSNATGSILRNTSNLTLWRIA